MFCSLYGFSFGRLLTAAIFLPRQDIAAYLFLRKWLKEIVLNWIEFDLTD